ncbi:MAG TPA: glycine cleavage system protein GcvH [Anaerohalosphaeraceae bacterium]|jgi:glycine cleavage system H protein|nr:glycine cleavage system protein GcvH [Anaerohalosphaeraceae bacterium]
MIDPEARYLRTHEWARREDGDVFTIGLSSYAIDQLGDIVFMELPQEGDTLDQGGSFGVVESVKAASDLYAPIGGEVVEVNEAVPENPDMLKEDPYEEGWLIKIKASNPEEFEEMMDAGEYKHFLETEGG